MCGVAGYLTAGAVLQRADLVDGLFRSIRRRGPDDEGICLVDRGRRSIHGFHTDRTVPAVRARLPHHRGTGSDVPHDLALLHTRYAVVDPTPAGHQPLVVDDDRVVVAFHGEIFNYRELRDELEGAGVRFRSSSDTEVLALAYRAWGDRVWRRLNGFWAAAVYDGRTGRFLLCRDRVGIAPFYVRETPTGLIFGTSALDLARTHEGGPRPNRRRVEDFLRTGLKDFGEETLFEGVRAISPGTCLVFEEDESRLDEARVVTYWSLPTDRISSGDLSLDDAAFRLRETLASAVELRLRSDLPVAFQLSSGLDSTSVVALAASMRSGPLPTFTASVPENDEEPLTRTMERRFDLHRRVLRGSEADFPGDAPAFARLMEEPVQAPAAYGHHRLCEMMAEGGFGVAVSGSGGDESLAGYQWDFWPAARDDLVARGRIVHALRYHAVLHYGSPRKAMEQLRGWLRRLGSLPARLVTGDTSAGVGAADPGEGELPDRSSLGRSRAEDLLALYPDLEYGERRRFHFRIADLPYYLVSNDRATLGIPIEHRQPFLDHRLVEFGLRMPVEHLFRDGWTKYALRRAMAPLLPEEIVWRREKLGFPYPVERLLRNARSAMEPALARVADEGFLEGGPGSYAKILAADPLGLWRACSTGLWLETLERSSA